MHIIVIAVGSAGDVHPLLGLSRTFSKHGHRVSFCTHPVFAEAVEGCGLRFLPLGTVEEYRAAMDQPEFWNPRTALKVVWPLLGKAIRPLFELLQAEVDSDTIVAAHPLALGARMFHDKYGVPLITLQVSPSTFLSAKRPPVHKQFTIPQALPYFVRAGLLWAVERGRLDRVCAPEINSFRAELGLPPVKRIMSRWIHSPQGVLGLYPDWFAPIESDWPAGFELTGFPLFDQSDLRGVDSELEDFLRSGPAPIVFTPGSTLVDELSYYRAAEAALNSLGHRGIFLASRCKALSERKRNILVRAYVPLSGLLPHARALVHHGGIGTASLALAAGVPQLITPFVFDQFDNAARVERLGCGFQIAAHASGSMMAQSLKLLLENDRIRQHCTTVRSWTDPGEVACMKALSAVEAFAARTLGSGGSGASVGPEEKGSPEDHLTLEDIFGRGW